MRKELHMRTFNYSKINQQTWDSEILSLIGAIYREVGKQELYLKQQPEKLEGLIEIAKIQSTQSSNAIEGIVTTNTRIKQLVQDKTTPKNRNEQEIAGYRDVLNLIHENYNMIPISKNYILQLHKMLYAHMNNPMAGKTKSVQNYISATYPDGHMETIFTPLEPFQTPEALERICDEYNFSIGNAQIEPLIAIPTFIHDFLCIHPFNDGNGRISRLLTTLLLYRNGFYVGKYISLEKIISEQKEFYYDALSQSQHGWHEGTENKILFIKYMLGTILKAYKDFEDRCLLIEPKVSALEAVKKATYLKIGKFTKQDICELCPSLSISSIENSLRKLVASGDLKREGVGKNTYYYHLK
jgi:Fic family protein